MIFHLHSAFAALAGTLFAVVAAERISLGAPTKDEVTVFCLCGVGGIIGGFLGTAVTPPRNPTWGKMGTRWVVCSFASFGFGPFLVEFIARKLDVPFSVFLTVAISTAIGAVAWQAIRLLQGLFTPESLKAALRKWLSP